MCIICVEFQKQRLTFQEARRNLGEMVDSIGEDHAQEVKSMLEEAEDQIRKTYQELEGAQVDLDEESQKALYENLDELYI